MGPFSQKKRRSKRFVRDMSKPLIAYGVLPEPKETWQPMKVMKSFERDGNRSQGKTTKIDPG
jgi:hypothetical protein